MLGVEAHLELAEEVIQEYLVPELVGVKPSEVDFCQLLSYGVKYS